MGLVKVYQRPTITSILNAASSSPTGGGGGTDPGGGAPGGGVVVPSGAIVGITRHGSTPYQILKPTSFFNTPIPSGVAIAPESSSVIAEVVKESQSGSRPAFQTTTWSMPTYTVPGTFPCVPVKIHTQPPPNYQVAMQDVLFSPGVPIPPEYINQGDSDSECLIYCPDLDLAWEFWRLKPLATPIDVTWTFGDGTVSTFTCHYECTNFWQITTVSTHLGRSRNNKHGAIYPHAPNTDALRRIYEDTNMSVAAARLPFLGGLLTVEDVQRGLNADGTLTGVEPDHAVSLSVIYPKKESNAAVKWPASSTDGFSTTSPIREGDRYILDQTAYTVAAINAMNVHPLCRLTIWFVVRRGYVVVDKSGALEVDAEPEVHQYFDGTAPSAILNGFPWADLKVIGKLNPDGVTVFYGSDATPNPLA